MEHFLPSLSVSQHIDMIQRIRKVRRIRLQDLLSDMERLIETRSRIHIIDAATDGVFFTQSQRRYLLRTRGTRLLRSHRMSYKLYNLFNNPRIVSMARSFRHLHLFTDYMSTQRSPEL
jgi:hypothetical protein